MAAKVISEAIKALIEEIIKVIREKKELEITMQDLPRANDLLKQVVENQENSITLMQEIAAATQTIPKKERQKIYRCIAQMYKNLITFEEECGRILTSNKENA